MAGNLSNGHRSFAEQIDWVNDLRVTQPVTRHPTALDPHMDPAGARALNEPAPALGKSAAEVAVFKPTIENETLVELQVANCGYTECHITSVRAVWLDARPGGRAID